MTWREYADQASAFALVEFGLRRAEFLALTPQEWKPIEAAWERRRDREDRRTARICLLIARAHGDDASTEEAFMPKPVDAEQETEPDPDDLMAAFLGATSKMKHNGR